MASQTNCLYSQNEDQHPVGIILLIGPRRKSSLPVSGDEERHPRPQVRGS